MCPRILRPYELRHTDTRFREWLRRQGLPEETWSSPLTEDLRGPEKDRRP
jgi:hypothetical protein